MSQTFYDRLGRVVADRVNLHLAPSIKKMELTVATIQDLVARFQTDAQKLSDDINAAIAKIQAVPNVPQEALDALSTVADKFEQMSTDLENATNGPGTTTPTPAPTPAPEPAPAPPPVPPDQPTA